MDTLPFKRGDEVYYTRAGNFYFDNDGFLVTGSGEYVLDATSNPTTQKKIQINNIAGNGVNIAGVESISIGSDGKVSYIRDGQLLAYPSDSTIAAAIPIAIVNFANNSGLEKAGGNLFSRSLSSGNPIFNTPGVNGAGTILSGALEMSNVDFADEFTEMIVSQRAFQANTKIITTSDEILQELVNLKR